MKLVENLKSHSHIIRQTSLELVELPFICSDDASEVVTRCPSAERVPLDVGGVRERALRTLRIGQQMHEAGSLPSALLTVWLLDQLKGNLRAAWTPTIQSVRSLSEFH